MKIRLGFVLLSTCLVLHAGSASALTVRSSNIVDGEVKTVDLGASAVTSAKIQDGAVMNADLANGSVTDAKLGTDVAARFAALEANVADLQAQLATLQGRLEAIQSSSALSLAPYVSVDSNTINGLAGPHIIITGANVHVRDGSNATASVAGLGNLIVGYNEVPQVYAAGRGGSHNLVIGKEHQYFSYAGLVAGWSNSLSGQHASVVGGFYNEASGVLGAAVLGGRNNVASGVFATVFGGDNNASGGDYTTVGGGFNNSASDGWASITGGYENLIEGSGYGAAYGTISGGRGNYILSNGYYGSISGGYQRSVNDSYDWAAGGLLQDQ